MTDKGNANNPPHLWISFISAVFRSPAYHETQIFVAGKPNVYGVTLRFRMRVNSEFVSNEIDEIDESDESELHFEQMI
jgi:hypothetical protein